MTPNVPDFAGLYTACPRDELGRWNILNAAVLSGDWQAAGRIARNTANGTDNADWSDRLREVADFCFSVPSLRSQQ